MSCIDTNMLASLLFEARWATPETSHTERLFARKVNFWRDFFPRDLEAALCGKKAGDHVTIRFRPGDVQAGFDHDKLRSIASTQFHRRMVDGRHLTPRIGRFYPQGLLSGMFGVYPQNILPFRVVDATTDSLDIDLNHPLAKYSFDCTVTVHDVATKQSDTGGQCHEWLSLLLEGPGMNARYNSAPTDFLSDDPFVRENTEDDRFFYSQARLVAHTDVKARECIARLYGRLLEPGMEVLDLMSSRYSHLPEGAKLKSLEGLGMNVEELEANPDLTGYEVHDLNRKPFLPYPDNSFDAVLCSVSVEYLASPFAVFKDVARALRPGGLFVCTFSNRWFPGKAVRIWTELHEFERLGLVSEYFLESGLFRDIETWSERGWPRPYDPDDRYFSLTPTADPIYAVWGRTAV